jgi:hypothetical protein
MKSIRVGLIGSFIFAASVWAGGSSLQGIVKDPAGQPLKGAEIRVEPRNGGTVLATAKSDAQGRYATANLPLGIYRVSLIVNGTVRSSINNTKTRANKPTELNFQLQGASAAQKPMAKKKHMVWMPANTGTHTGGRWVEVDEGGAAAADASNVSTATAEQLQRQIHSSDQRGGDSTGMSTFGR